MEEWRDIEGLEGRYQVSNHGNVRSVARMHGGRNIPSVVKKLEVHWKGYHYVKVWDYIPRPYIKRKYFIHRLVAIAFLPNPEGKPIVNHLDRNKGNNHISNLEWATESENTLHWMQDEKNKKAIHAGE